MSKVKSVCKGISVSGGCHRNPGQARSEAAPQSRMETPIDPKL